MPPKKNKKGRASKDSTAESQSGSSQESRSQASQSSLSQSSTSLTSGAPPASAVPQPSDQRGGERGIGRGRGQGQGPQVGQTGPPPSAAAFPQLSEQRNNGADQRGGGRGRGRGQGRSQGRGGGQERSDKDSGAGDPFPSLQPAPAPPPSVWGRQQTPQGSSQVPVVQEPKERVQPPQVTQSAQKQQAPTQMVQQQPTPDSRTDPAACRPQAAATVAVVSKPAPIQSSDVEQISERISLMNIAGIPKRKNPLKAGTEGRHIQVLTNMLAINFEKNFCSNVIHYDLDIQPTCPKYLMRPAFRAAKDKLFPKRNPAFDGRKNVYSGGLLPIPNQQATTEVTIYNEDGRERKFNVTIKKVKELDLSWLKTVKAGSQERDLSSIQALDIILRNAAASICTTVGRSFFSAPKGQVMSLGGGMDLWVGLFQSAVLGWKPFLNIDVAHKGFPTPQNVINIMKTICGCDDQNQEGGQGGSRQYQRPQQGYQRGYPSKDEFTNRTVIKYKEDIKKYLKGLKVTIEIPGQPTSRRTQRVNDLVTCPAENLFEHDGNPITVLEYYKKVKQYVIKYPSIPCLWVGNRDKNIHVPPELCTIVAGQSVQRKLDETQTANMIKYAATGTDLRKRKIMEAFNKIDRNADLCMRNEFGVSVGGEFEKVNARVLEPPRLTYQSQRAAMVSKGVWRAEKFNQPSQLISPDNSWTILNLCYRTKDNDLYPLSQKIRQIGANVGMSIGAPVTPFVHLQINGNNIIPVQNFFLDQKDRKMKLIVVVVPDTKGSYSKVKQISELNVGVLTQCIKSFTVKRKLNDATVGNILLKINAKLNGVNHIFEKTVSRPSCLTKPCMIVGADVTHPSPDATDIPSIAAVAASHDPNAFQYNIEIRLQPAREEVIRDLKEIMVIQLKYFYKKTNYQPQRIIFYRDGVSEGQFAEIMQKELKAIRDACQSLNPNYKPNITFLVVQKRHHIRLFPTDERNSDDAHRGFNVQAGTIVDTMITHPTDIDFYLVSHASIQGTARPTKYRCLWDDSDYTENDIEKLTYFLCHMFSRCTRSVSYPTPTYYAHLAAFRARALTQDVPIDMNNLNQEQLRKLTIKPDVLKEMPMFFV